MIQPVERDRILDALRRFDEELRGSPQWANWEEREKYRYAIGHEGRRYPVKKIISLATGQPVAEYSGGRRSNDYVKARGFNVVLLHEPGESLQGIIERVMQEYVAAREGAPFSGNHNAARVFRELAERLGNCDAVANRPTVKVIGSAGQGNWANVPWVAFLDSRETTSTQRGVYAVLLFRQDMSGAYVTFNQGVTEPKRQKGNAGGRSVLRERAATLRKTVSDLGAQGFKLDDHIDLRCESGLGVDYEASTVAYKLYEKGSVPVDEEILDDVEALLAAYDRYLAESGTSGTGDFLSVMRRYQAEGVVFRSAIKGARYYVADVGGDSCTVQRIDAAESERCSVAQYDRALAAVRNSGGRQAREELANNPAVRATLRQGPGLDLSTDRLYTVDVSTPESAERAFIEQVRGLRVDTSSGVERPYKPAMLACVIEGIEQSELIENKVLFDWIAPRWAEMMRSLGSPVPSEKAALPFFHLASDPFWMLCYHDPTKPFGGDTPSAAAIRQQIRHATLKDTYWSLLRDEGARRRVLTALGERWFGTSAPRAWMFQANPKVFDLRGAAAALSEGTWTVSQFRDAIHEGDTVFFWESGPNGGVVATGTALSEPGEMEQLAGELAFVRQAEKLSGKRLRVRVSFHRTLTTPLARKELLEHVALKSLAILAAPEGTNFPVTDQQLWPLEVLVAERDGRRIVKIAPGENARFWHDCLRDGAIYVGWDEVGDLAAFADEDAFRAEFATKYRDRYNGSEPRFPERRTSCGRCASCGQGT